MCRITHHNSKESRIMHLLVAFHIGSWNMILLFIFLLFIWKFATTIRRHSLSIPLDFFIYQFEFLNNTIWSRFFFFIHSIIQHARQLDDGALKFPIQWIIGNNFFCLCWVALIKNFSLQKKKRKEITVIGALLSVIQLMGWCIEYDTHEKWLRACTTQMI